MKPHEVQTYVDGVEWQVDGLMTIICGGSLPFTAADLQALPPGYTDADKAVLWACSELKRALVGYK